MPYRTTTVLVLSAVFPAFPLLGQLDSPGCPEVTLPVQSIVRPAGHINTAADNSVAAGPEMIVTCSNVGVRLHCKEGGQKTGQIPLNGPDLNGALFVKSPGLLDGTFHAFFDPRVIYDPFESPPRFWIITSERGDTGADVGPNDPLALLGRIHIAVSTHSVPESFGTGHWNKYTSAPDPDNGNQLPPGAKGASFLLNDPALGDYLGEGLPLSEGLGRGFADRPSVMVDENYLYIAPREAILYVDGPRNPWDERTLMVAIPKAPMLAGQAAAIEKALWIDAGEQVGMDRTWAHELAVDLDGTDDGGSKVYMVTMPRLYMEDPPATGIRDIQFRDLVLGAFYKDGGGWHYKSTLVDLIDDAPPPGFAARRFRGVYQSAPGGGTDTNHIIFGNFWSCVTRSVGGVKKIWATHHVREFNDNGQNPTVSRIQYYEIDPGTWPESNQTMPKFTAVNRRSLGAEWAHDPSMSVNSSGDKVLHFTRAGPASDPAKYPKMYRWVVQAGGGESTTLVKSGPAQHYDPPSPFFLDFSGTAVDPSNGCIFWGHSAIVLDIDQWQSYLANVDLCGERPGGDDEDTLLLWLEFLNAFNQQDEEADLDGDGTIDALDLLEFAQQVGR